MIYMIVARSRNGVIGNNGKIPWHISEDLKHFRKITLGKNVVMGRKTFESLPNGPLDQRNNIVLTRNNEYDPGYDGVEVVNSLDVILNSSEDYYIIGGEEIYREFLPFAEVLYETIVKSDVIRGDAFFPDVEWPGAIHILADTPVYQIRKITKKQKDNNDSSGNQAGRKKRATRRRQNP